VKKLTDLEKIQKQLRQIDVDYIIQTNPTNLALLVYSLDGEWLGSLCFDFNGKWLED